MQRIGDRQDQHGGQQLTGKVVPAEHSGHCLHGTPRGRKADDQYDAVAADGLRVRAREAEGPSSMQRVIQDRCRCVAHDGRDDAIEAQQLDQHDQQAIVRDSRDGPGDLLPSSRTPNAAMKPARIQKNRGCLSG